MARHPKPNFRKASKKTGRCSAAARTFGPSLRDSRAPALLQPNHRKPKVTESRTSQVAPVLLCPCQVDEGQSADAGTSIGARVPYTTVHVRLLGFLYFACSRQVLICLCSTVAERTGVQWHETSIAKDRCGLIELLRLASPHTTTNSVNVLVRMLVCVRKIKLD